jgi:type II secretory pathway pseudopilin PulG
MDVLLIVVIAIVAIVAILAVLRLYTRRQISRGSRPVDMD